MHTKLSTTALLLIIFQITICPIVAVSDTHLDTTKLFDISGIIEYKGFVFRYFEAHGRTFAEPALLFGRFSATLGFNRLYQKYQLSIPITIDGNVLSKSGKAFSNIQAVSIRELTAHLDEEVLTARKEIFAVHATVDGKTDKAELRFLCNSADSCRQLKEEFNSNVLQFLLSLKFTASGKAGNFPVRFTDVSPIFEISLDSPKNSWVVFQRRVDGTLSFAKDWATYVAGFGSQDSSSNNYWMGLEQLSSETNIYQSKCDLRIETQDLDGHKYWGEWNSFKILGADKLYELNLGETVNGTMFDHFKAYHNKRKFSTFDKVYNRVASSTRICPAMYSNGGWWFTDCFKTYLNGRYTATKPTDTTSGLWGRVINKGLVQMKHSKMMFKCA